MLIQLKERDLKPKTIESYRYLLNNLLPEIGHLKLTEITPRRLNTLYAKLGEDGRNKATGGRLSGKTILEYARFISVVLEQASDELLVPFNAARKAQPPKRVRREISCLQPEEIKCIFDALETGPPKWRALVHLLAASGARRGEILALKWDKIDFKNNQIEITGNLLYSPELGIYETTPKTKRSVRFIKLPEQTMNVLREYKVWYNQMRLAFGSDWKKTNYVFVQEGEHPGLPMHPDSVSSWISKFAKRHGFPHCSAHTFRHSLASMLISEGTDVVSVSRRLGHSDISTTLDIYSHAIKRADERATESIADVLYR